MCPVLLNSPRTRTHVAAVHPALPSATLSPRCREPEGLSHRAQAEGPSTHRAKGQEGQEGPACLGSNRAETLAGGTAVRHQTLPLGLMNPLQRALCLRMGARQGGDNGHRCPHLTNYYNLCSSDEGLF